MTDKRALPYAAVFGLSLLVSSATPIAAQTCGPWEWIDPTPVGRKLTDVLFVADRFLIFGEGGTVLSSRDGENFELHPPTMLVTLEEVAYDGSSFAAVDDFRIYSSIDGITWAERYEVGVPDLVVDIAAGNGTFVAVGGGGFVFESPLVFVSHDGESWHSVRAPAGEHHLYSVAWGGGTFVAVGGGGTILTSVDGEAWSAQHSGTTQSLTSVVAGDGFFLVAGGGNDLPHLLRSVDGVSWETRSVDGDASHLEAADGLVLMTTAPGIVQTSSDGLTWSSHTVEGLRYISGAARHGSAFVAVGLPELLTSSDGASTWRAGIVVDRIAPLADLMWTGSSFLAVGEGLAATSIDGGTWTPSALPAGVSPRRIAIGGGLIVAVGHGGIITSTDGVTWVRQNTPTGWGAAAVAWGGGLFVAVGSPGVVLTSADGVSWISHAVSPLDRSLLGIAWGNGRFVAVGDRRVFVSDDGVSWTALAGGPGSPTDVVWGAGRFLIPGVDGLIYASTDGISWAVVQEGLLYGSRIVWTGIDFVAGNGLTLMSSPDGLEWHVDPAPLPMLPTSFAVPRPTAFARGGGWLLAISDTSIVRRACDGGLAKYYLPAVAHLPGLNGSLWRSDLEVHNPGTTMATFTVDLLERGKANLSPASHQFLLEPGKSVRYRDVLPSMFAYDGAATLRLSSYSSGLLANSRTYTETESGSFGDYIESVAPGTAIVAGRPARLTHLSHSANRSKGSRTNLGLVNASAAAVLVEVNLFAASGAAIGGRTYGLRPFESLQINDVFAQFTAADVDDAYATVSTPTAGGALFAYASVVDNRSNDPMHVPAR